MLVVTRVLALAALCAFVAAAPASAKLGDLYAFRYGAHDNVLTPYDPVRLVASGPKISMGRFGHAWSLSPDRSRLVAAAGVRRAGEPTAVRFVDLARGAIEGTLTLPGELRRVTATAWVRGRVLVVVAGSGSTTVYSVDADRRAVVGRVEIPGALVSGERTASRLVLLLAPVDGIGATTVAVVDQTPRVRTVVLERVASGTLVAGEGNERRVTVRRPGTAVAPSGLRLHVLGAREPAASVDLRTLAVEYAPVRRPAAVRKRVDGAARNAATLPDGRIVLWGFDYGSSTRVGVSLVDPRDWTARTLDASATWVRVSGGLIFSRGRGGVGLRILRPSGEAVKLFATGSPATVHVVGPRALVTFFGSGRKAAVIELGSLRVVRHTVPAHPLIGAGQPIAG